MDGVILIDKPEGMTSFSAVAIVHKRLGVKCGHSGTLDPMATGLLPVMCGKATKLCEYLTSGDKGYRATLRFGSETDTGDITGTVTATDSKDVTLDEILGILPEFTGKILQTPPAYSAIKQNGVPLYKLARQGIAVDVPVRTVSVYSIKVVDFSGRELIMDVECSKGTYIRSLCADIAKRLGTVGTMSALRRTHCSHWNVSDAVLPDGDLEAHMITMDEALCEYPEFKPDAFYARLLQNGCAVEKRKLGKIPDGISRIYGDRLLGLGRLNDDGTEYKIITHL